ncbi:MAG: GWxTD domain-containing protein [Bacteroidales bacterium]|nr:GWxTD domain-containing protein [Bacteroidales bacterium]
MAFIKATAIASVVFFTVLAISCKNTEKSTSGNKYNLSAIYNPASGNLHPSYKVFHNASDISLLYGKVFTSELLFQPTGENGALRSKISLNYMLYFADSSNIADSGTYSYDIYKSTPGNSYLFQIPMKAETGNSYRLKLVLKDNQRKTTSVSFLEIEKHPEFGQQFFNLTGLDGKPFFNNVLIGNGAFRLLHNTPSSDKLFISYYLNNTPLPKPTYAAGSDEFVYSRPDSLYIINYSPEQALTLAHEGLYFIQFDTASQEGVAVARFGDNFPKVDTPDDLLHPLAYITTTAEYNKLIESSNKKLAADNFWINTSGSTGRGKEMIRIYYNRVYFANYYFTNTRPGWKTDRGMVYIVYGPPHNLRKTANAEIWNYYRNNNEISFKFNYKPNKYHLNQYILERAESQSWHWREAVYGWTHGKIFLQK